jgi:hypothetical protein
MTLACRGAVQVAAAHGAMSFFASSQPSCPQITQIGPDEEKKSALTGNSPFCHPEDSETQGVIFGAGMTSTNQGGAYGLVAAP